MTDIKNKISLSLISSYAPTWGIWEGIRELVQNWHDGLYETIDSFNSDTHIISKKVKIKEVKPQGGSPVDKEYRATIKDANGQEVVLGIVKLDGIDNRLLLINKGVSLHKKILLLGYSKKSKNRHVIGHFGEGLKVGALALVRGGRTVSMETSQDKWRFDLVEDPDFGEKVLTVIVTERGESSYPPSLDELEDEDTCTSVSLDSFTWQKLCKRFLFLCPAKDFIKTEIGNLLLDEELNSQLYVKGVWVSDMTAEGLSSGVDFTNLPLDRDRNAVPKPSEIDHQVSCMWIKAVKQRPSLTEKYFALLSDNESKDVRQVMTYADEETAQAIAAEFLQQYGEDVFPVGQDATGTDFATISNLLDKQVLIVNNALLSLLHMSGKYGTLEAALFDHTDDDKVIKPIQLLSTEEWSVLNHASQLVQMYAPAFSLDDVDIVEDLENQSCTRKDDRIEIPTCFFDLEKVHTSGNLCDQDQEDQCLCREVRLAYSLCLLNACKEVLGSDPTKLLLKMIHPLALQSCNSAKPFCDSLHNSTATCNCNADHEMCIQREDTFRIQVENLNEKHLLDIATLKEQLDKVQKLHEGSRDELLQREIKIMNQEHEAEKIHQSREQKIKSEYDLKLDQLEKSVTEKKELVVDAKIEIENLKETLEDCKKGHEEWKEANSTKYENLIEELNHYVSQCSKRTKEMQELCEANLVKETDDNVREKWRLASELSKVISKGLEQNKILCCVCKYNIRTTILLPCGHYQLCESCAGEQMRKAPPRCPTCRTEIGSLKTVYE